MSTGYIMYGGVTCLDRTYTGNRRCSICKRRIRGTAILVKVEDWVRWWPWRKRRYCLACVPNLPSGKPDYHTASDLAAKSTNYNFQH